MGPTITISSISIAIPHIQHYASRVTPNDV